MTRDAERDYADNVGRDPRNLPADHPDRWQWEYSGTKADREELLERLDLAAAPEDEGPPQEEQLFGRPEGRA